jgi:ribosomal protein S9
MGQGGSIGGVSDLGIGIDVAGGTGLSGAKAQVRQAIARMFMQPDEGSLSKLPMEVVLLEFADWASTSDPYALKATAKR